VFIIGIDPHKGSHTAAVLDHSETVIGELRVIADRRQRDRLLEFAADFMPRTWAIEAASGLGALLAQQLVAAGETVLDVPPTLSARVRLLDAGCTDKTDPHDARAAAIVALRHTRLRQSLPLITLQCCACWRTATMTSPDRAPRRSVVCMRCCAGSPLAARGDCCRPNGRWGGSRVRSSSQPSSVR
jgi:transposase